MLSIIRETINELPLLRGDPEQWNRCGYREFTHPEFGKQDANASERYRFLIALQYEYLPEDESLVRYLFVQEVLARSNDGFQGFGEALRLASYLLSRWKRAGDFWRYASAKLANFDTYCGYDSQFLFTAGRDAALAEFANTDHELKEQIRGFLFDDEGNCRFDADEIEAWQGRLVAEFPKRPEDEPLMVWIDRAIAFESREEGLLLLDQLEAAGTDESPSTISYLREQLGDLQGALEKRRAMLDLAEDDWDRVFNACSVAELHLKAGQPEEAWATIHQFVDRLTRIKGWNEVGLGRSVVEVAFRVAQTAPPDVARAAFAWACLHEAQLKTSSHLIMSLAAEAATRLEDSAKATHYQAAADAEQRKIDEILEKL